MIYDIIIIGAGAAGMTAGIYGVRAGKTVLVLEKKAYGGQILTTTKIENYPAAPHISGVNFSKKLYEQAKELGVEFKLEEVLSIGASARAQNSEKASKSIKSSSPIFHIKTDETEYSSRTLIFANGSTERKLGLEREKELTGRGISYCATCDGNLYKGKPVAVNGGGNSALWSAYYLSSLASEVYLIHRRTEFRADKVLIKKVSALKNVKIITPAEIKSLSGEEKLEKISLTNGEELKIDALFISVGRVPENERFEDLVILDKEGYIKVNENLETSLPGVFAAGDVRKKSLNQLVTATSDGAIAATSAITFLNTKK